MLSLFVYVYWLQQLLRGVHLLDGSPQPLIKDSPRIQNTGYLNRSFSFSKNSLCTGFSNSHSSDTSSQFSSLDLRWSNTHRGLSIGILSNTTSFNKRSKSISHSCYKITSLRMKGFIKSYRSICDDFSIHNNHIRTTC